MKNLGGYQIEILRYAQNDKNILLIADWYHPEELKIPVLIQSKKARRRVEETGCCSTCFINASLSRSGRVKYKGLSIHAATTSFLPVLLSMIDPCRL